MTDNLTELKKQIDKMLTWNIQGHTEPVVFQPEMKAAITKLCQAYAQQVAREARVEEVKQALGWFTNESGYLFYLDDRLAELKDGHASN